MFPPQITTWSGSKRKIPDSQFVCQGRVVTFSNTVLPCYYRQAENSAIPLASSSNGRASGKPWKALKSATVRSQCSKAHKTKWKERMEKDKKEKAIKKLENELKEERRVELQRRREVTTERKRAAEERRRLEEERAKMSARKAARLRRKAGRSKKIKG